MTSSHGLQIDIILAGDPQLAKEILYDMRQADNAQRAAAERVATAVRAGSGGNVASAEAARRLSGSRTPGSGRGQQGGGRGTDLRQEALRRSLQLPRRSGSGGAHRLRRCFALLWCTFRRGRHVQADVVSASSLSCHTDGAITPQQLHVSMPGAYPQAATGRASQPVKPVKPVKPPQR